MTNKIFTLVLIGMASLMTTGYCLGQDLPVVLSFTAEPTKICNGQSINLSWEVDDADNISIEPDLFIVETRGSKNIFPKNNTTYKLTAKNANGNITADLNVTVNDCIAIEKFLAKPQQVCKGSNATIQWMVVGATKVTIDNDIGEVNSTGSIEITGNENTTYNLTAINGTLISNANLTLAVDLRCPSIEYFDVDRPDIIKGSNASLSWNITNAENVSIDNGIGEVGLSGSKMISPDSSVIYKINATNGTNFITSEKIVNVSTKFPEILDFTARPSTVVRGTGSILSWNVTDADYVSIDHNIGEVAGNSSKEVIGEEDTTYILTAGNASGNVTEMATISVDDTAYDFVARAEYADWYAEINNQRHELPDFPISETSIYGYARWGDDAQTILKIGPREGGKIIGDYTRDMVNMGYFIDPRDTLSIWAEAFDPWNPMTDVIIEPVLGTSQISPPDNIYFGSPPVDESTSLREYAGDRPRFSLVIDCNGRDYGDDVNIKKLKIVRA